MVPVLQVSCFTHQNAKLGESRVSLLLLYMEFFQIGLFAVGGGFATLPFLFLMANDRSLFIRQTGWLSTENLGNFIAISQCAPGAIGVNIAVQTGFLYGGIAGGIIASLGLVSPAIVVVALVFRIMQSFKDSKVAIAVFTGLRPAAAGLICAAGFGVWKLALHNPAGASWFESLRWKDGLVAGVILFLLIKFGWHPVVYIAIGAVAGVLLGFVN